MAAVKSEHYPYYYTRYGASECSDTSDWSLSAQPPPPPKVQELYRRRSLNPHGHKTCRKPPPSSQPPSSLAPPSPSPYPVGRKKRRPHMVYTPYRVNSEEATSSDAVLDARPRPPPPGGTTCPVFRRSRSSGFPRVATPRFYRQVRSSKIETGAMRRPSKLCLPLTCQPEPIYRSRVSCKKIPRSTHRLVYHHPCCPGVVPDDVLCPLLCATTGEPPMGPPPARRRTRLQGDCCASAPRLPHNKHKRRQSRSDVVAAEIQAVSSDLDALLAEYERMFAESSLRLGNSSSERTTGRAHPHRPVLTFPVPVKPPTMDVMAMMQPRKTDLSRFQPPPIVACSIPACGIPPLRESGPCKGDQGQGDDVLDGLLSDLVARGFTDANQSETVRSMYTQLQEQVPNNPKPAPNDDGKIEESLSNIPPPTSMVDTIYQPSYTLQDMFSRKKPIKIEQASDHSGYKLMEVNSNASNISKVSNRCSREGLTKPTCTLHNQCWPHSRKGTSIPEGEVSATNDTKLQEDNSESQKPDFSTDKDTGTELHNSKSYIINMIDNAVKCEMKTITEEGSMATQQVIQKAAQKCNTSQQSSPMEDCVQMEIDKAIDLVNSESSCRLNPDLCMKITQTLTDTLVSSENKLPSEPLFTSNFAVLPGEEPSYIKQLRQLRRDHIKHIQKEMKTVEDIDRLLDNCTSWHSMYKNISSASL